MSFYIEITPEIKKYQLNLKELWRYRYLVWLLTKKAFAISYKQTILGPLWLLIAPVMYSCTYSIIFGKVAGIRTDGVPQFLFYMCSNTLWGMFSSSIHRNANLFRDNQGLFGKVYFSRLTVPVSNIAVSLITYFIQALPAVVMTVYYAANGAVHPIWPAWLLLPCILLHLSMLGMSVGLFASSVTAKYRDFSVLISTGVSLWMYLTPMIYPLSVLSPGLIRSVVLLNPVSAPLELYRLIMLGSGTPDIRYILYSLLVTVCLLLGSIVVFHRVERNYLDTV